MVANNLSCHASLVKKYADLAHSTSSGQACKLYSRVTNESKKAPGSVASSPGAPNLASQYNDDRLPLTDDGPTAFGQSSELVARSRNLGNTLGGFRPGVNG